MWVVSLQNLLQEPGQQLRRDQGVETWDCVKRAVNSSRPSRVKGGAKVPTVSELKEAVAARNKDAAAVPVATSTAPDRARDENPEGQEQEETEEEDEIEDAGRNTLQESLAQVGNGKQRSKAAKQAPVRSRISGKMHAVELAGSASQAPPTGIEDTRSEAGKVSLAGTKRLSLASGSGGRGAAGNKAAKVKEHFDELSLEKVLLGKQSFKAPIYNAKRTLDLMAKEGTSAEVVMLRSHLTLVTVAQACTPTQITKLTPLQRTEHLRMLQSAGVKFPVSVCMTLLELVTKEQVREKNYAASIAALNPWSTASTKFFEPEHPCMTAVVATAPSDEMEEAVNQWKMLVMNNIVLPVLDLGAEGTKDLEHVLQELRAQLSVDWGAVGDTHPAILIAVVREVLDCCALLEGFLQGGLGLDAAAVIEMRDFLSSSTARRSVVKRIVREALSQAPYYKDLLLQWQKLADNIAHHGPALDQATKKMKEVAAAAPSDAGALTTATTFLQELAGKYPTWHTMLPLIASAPLRSALLTVYDEFLKRISKQEQDLLRCKKRIEAGRRERGRGGAEQECDCEIEVEKKRARDTESDAHRHAFV